MLRNSQPGIECEILVPAKAMLFGEYGVLHDGIAVAATLPIPRFRLRLVGRFCQNGPGWFEVRSDFFPGGNIRIFPSSEIGTSAIDSVNSDPNVRFFRGTVQPYLSDIFGLELQLDVLESFPPHLGLGSSSALIAGLHSLLAVALSRDLSAREQTTRLLHSLKAAQPNASGYDVCVQAAALSHVVRDGDRPHLTERFWCFERLAGDEIKLREIAIDASREFGVLLASGCYSDTARVVAQYDTKARRRFAQQHAELSSEFLAQPSAKALPALFARSRQIAREQGIVPPCGSGGVYAELCDLLDREGLAWKSMGAGLGDSLWVLAKKEQLDLLIHPITGRRLSDDLVYDFAASCERGNRDVT